MATHDLEIGTGRLSDPAAAAEKDEEVVLTGDGEPPARSAPVRRGRKAGSARGLFTVPDDFDEPLEDFRDYL
jgi:antitoxin (DNA-binding transcriptional repressor) of toxin-antitoxin stability system